VGTAFTVKVRDGSAEVTVTEGVVQVQRAGEPDSPPIKRLGANQRASVTQARTVEVHSIEPSEVERRLAWIDGRVAFDGESLADAVAQINAHNRRQIVIADPELAAQPIIGVFRADEIETFARTAAEILGARVVEDGDTISLHRKLP
jgi:transmembrane sensor